MGEEKLVLVIRNYCQNWTAHVSCNTKFRKNVTACRNNSLRLATAVDQTLQQCFYTKVFYKCLSKYHISYRIWNRKIISLFWQFCHFGAFRKLSIHFLYLHVKVHTDNNIMLFNKPSVLPSFYWSLSNVKWFVSIGFWTVFGLYLLFLAWQRPKPITCIKSLTSLFHCIDLYRETSVTDHPVLKTTWMLRPPIYRSIF